MKVHVCNPHGYCEGVFRAINIALETRKTYPDRPVAVLGMLVHNEFVIDFLNKHQIETLSRPDENYEDFFAGIDPETIIIFTAHGHPKFYDNLVKKYGLMSVDATCPKVEITHEVILSALDEKHSVIYIGQFGHPETEAALSLNNDFIHFYDINSPFDYSLINDEKPVVTNQTTLSIDELANIHQEIKQHFPLANIENEICSATRLRQVAVKRIPQEADIIYIVGSFQSNNSRKLVDIAKSSHQNAEVYQIQSLQDINSQQLQNKTLAAVAAGASTPKEITEEVISYLRNFNE